MPETEVENRKETVSEVWRQLTACLHLLAFVAGDLQGVTAKTKTVPCRSTQPKPTHYLTLISH